ncbi:MAG: universal stress protein [Solirubrobacterales bacterium]
MQRKMIIAYDGSAGGDDAVAMGGVLAEALGAKPLIATVQRIPPYLVAERELREMAEADSEPLFARAREALPGLEVETATLFDESAGRALSGLIETEKPVAVALGSAHRGPVGRVLLGSLGTAMLSGSECPIAIAPAGYAKQEPHKLRRIAVGVSESAEAEAAVAAARGLATRLHADLKAVAVAPPLATDLIGAILSMLGKEEVEGPREQELQIALDGAVADLPGGIEARSTLLHGEPATELIDASDDADLLVLGSRAYGPVRRTLLGSVSAEVARSCPCCVLVLTRKAGADPLGLEGAEADRGGEE